MSKPVVVIDPVTGQQSYTKHPEKLIQRKQARMESARLRIIATREAQAAVLNPTYWNGARSRYDELGRDQAMFVPGCNVVFPKVGTLRAARRYANSST